MAELLFGNITKTPEDYEQAYPKRNLEEGAVVTRFAPSPTGFLHFGGLFAAFIEKTAAKTTNGVFYLRIEDTDKKREVENGVSLIVKGLNDFGIEIDEGMLSETEEKGAYGPYMQSKRTEIYMKLSMEIYMEKIPCEFLFFDYSLITVLVIFAWKKTPYLYHHNLVGPSGRYSSL